MRRNPMVKISSRRTWRGLKHEFAALPDTPGARLLKMALGRPTSTNMKEMEYNLRLIERAASLVTAELKAGVWNDHLTKEPRW